VVTNPSELTLRIDRPFLDVLIDVEPGESQ
jgi:hypothetical protein